MTADEDDDVAGLEDLRMGGFMNMTDLGRVNIAWPSKESVTND